MTKSQWALTILFTILVLVFSTILWANKVDVSFLNFVPFIVLLYIAKKKKERQSE